MQGSQTLGGIKHLEMMTLGSTNHLIKTWRI